MAEIVASGLLYYTLSIALISLVRPIDPRVLLFSMAYFVMLITLASVNFEYDIVEQKFASTFSFERYQGVVTRMNDNFLFQAIVSSAAYFITDRWYSVIGVNVAIVSSLFLFSDRLRVAFLIVFLAPGMLHIAIFALRDVVLAATLFIYCYAVLAASKPRFLIGGALLVMLYMQRPELIAVIAAAALAINYREFGVIQKSALFVATIAMVIFVLPRLPVVLGLPPAASIFDLPEILINFSQLRADRWTGTEGANTAILGGQLTSVPIFLRYPIQMVAFFVSPLPTDINGPASLVFLIDSAFFIWLFVAFWRVADRRFKIFLIAYILTNAFFMANYGNLFRLRMPCYLIMFAGMLKYLDTQHGLISSFDIKQRLRRSERHIVDN